MCPELPKGWSMERAGIGRVTFFTETFSNKEEVLKRSFNMELQAWLSERQIDLSDWTDGQLLSALRQFLTFGMSNRINIRLLICLTGILTPLLRSDKSCIFQRVQSPCGGNWHWCQRSTKACRLRTSLLSLIIVRM